MRSIIIRLFILLGLLFPALASEVTPIRRKAMLWALVSFLLLAHATQAQASLMAGVSFGTGSNPKSVAVGDFNGDGKADLVAANYYRNNISILLGNGNGTFATAVNYAVETGPHSLAIGDFNGDGKADLAVVNTMKVSILLGNGNGAFTTAGSYGEFYPQSVVVGDFNGDGNADLAVTIDPALSNGHVSILLGNGNGTFAAAVNYGAIAHPGSVAAGDFNGDGKVDLAVATYGGVAILLGNGNGTFAEAVNYGARWFLSVVVGDFNGDGNADLAMLKANGSYVSILLGNGNGTFAAAGDYSVGSMTQSVAVGDFNGDGKADLVVATYPTNNVSILLGNGNGSFAAAVSFVTGSGSPPNPDIIGDLLVTVGDFNGDVIDDLAAVNIGGVAVLLSSPQTISLAVVEFYNTTLDNYFITADANEAAQIDGGAAGPGWIRTGNTFKSGGSASVCRFYGSYSPGPNSHFYTVDSGECQSLKDQQFPAGDPRKLTDKSWNFESLDFVSTPATNQTCPTGTTPVYRAYNNGFTRGVDSNHRITSSTTAIQEVVTRGWSNEGVVMCAPN